QRNSYVKARLAGAEDIAGLFTVADILLVVVQRAVDVAAVNVDDAGLAVNGPTFGNRGCRHHVERRLVRSPASGEVAREFLDRTLGFPRVLEALISDMTKLANAPAAAEHVVRGVQIEALPIPAFGLVMIAQLGDIFVGTTEVERVDRLRGGVADG